jgi:hypothetical protein
VVGEKRGPEDSIEEGRPSKNIRVGGSSTREDGLHRLQLGVPAQRFVLPAVFAYGGEVFDGNTEVVIPEADQAIMSDMGPESLKNVIARASMASLQLMEVANFLNCREQFFVQETKNGEARMKTMEKNYKKMEAELKNARLDF